MCSAMRYEQGLLRAYAWEVKVKVLVAQSFLTVWDSVDCSLPGSSVHVFLQARILAWVAIPFSRGSSWPKDLTLVSCIASRLFTVWATKEAHLSVYVCVCVCVCVCVYLCVYTQTQFFIYSVQSVFVFIKWKGSLSCEDKALLDQISSLTLCSSSSFSNN